MKPQLCRFRATLALTSFLGIAGCTAPSDIHRDDIVTIAQVHRQRKETRSSIHVRFRGELTLNDSIYKYVVVQDWTAGIRVRPSTPISNSLIGHTVEVEGQTDSGVAGDGVSNAEIKDVGSQATLQPVPLSGGDFKSDRLDSMLVSFSGVPRSTHITQTGQLSMSVESSGTLIDVRLIDDRASTPRRYDDAEVAISGVASTTVDVDGKVTGFAVTVPDASKVVITKPAVELERLPVTTVAQLSKIQDTRHLIRLQGRMQNDNLSGWRFTDDTGTIAVKESEKIAVLKQDWQDLAAFVVKDGSGFALSTLTFLDSDEQGKVGGIATADRRPALTTAIDVHKLKPEVAQLHLPVQIEGVITFKDPVEQSMFVQDKTAGIYVNLHGADASLVNSGDRVLLSGVSGAGDFAPIVEKPRFKLLKRDAYPAPSTMNPEETFLGMADSQWVELQGVVQRTGNESSNSPNTVAWGIHRFNLLLPHSRALPSDWKNARVRVRGACGTLFNSKRQLVGIQIFVPGLDQIELVDGQRSKPFETPARPINSLLQFSPGEDIGHRVHVKGEVLATHLNGPTWIRDRSGAVKIRTHDQVDLTIGDVVDVAGFAVPGGFSPALEDAELRKISNGSNVAAAHIRAEEALFGNRDSQLIQIDAKVLDQFNNSQGRTIWMQAGKLMFSARGDANLPEFQRDSILRVTGICTIAADTSKGLMVPRSFELQIRSPADVTVLRAAPLLTTEVTYRALAITFFLISAVSCWVLILRRRVQSQTQIIQQKLVEVDSLREAAEAASRAKSEFLAVMSHEIRTPMNGVIGMASVLLESPLSEDQVDCVKTIKHSGDLLLTVLNDILDFSKIEAGKLHLEHIRFPIRQVLHDCAALMREAAQKKDLVFVERIGDDVPEAMFGDPTRLRQVLLNLLSNAVKFTSSGSIGLRLGCDYLPNNRAQLRFEVTDSGIGIDEATIGRLFSSFSQADSSTTRRYGGTGLGLAISKRLIEMMGGVIEVQSEVGIGSCFSFVLETDLEASAGEVPCLTFHSKDAYLPKKMA